MTDQVTVHEFRSTGEAYDASQSPQTDRPVDGDVLNVPDEGVVGIMVSDWPTAIVWPGMNGSQDARTEGSGAFHTARDGVDWSAVPKTCGEGVKDYSASVARALAVAADEELVRSIQANKPGLSRAEVLALLRRLVV